MLEARGLTKWYGGVLAVSDVSFTVESTARGGQPPRFPAFRRHAARPSDAYSCGSIHTYVSG
jgi:hypothetical protein